MMKLSTLSSFILPSQSGIPILMYHEIHHARRDGLTVKTSDFSTQLNWLKSQGYLSVSLNDFLDFQDGKIKLAQLPEKPLLLTFDDGYRGLVNEALPVLKEQGFRASLFGTTSYFEERIQNEKSVYLSPAELRTWVESGMEVALHSHAHLSYKNSSAEDIIKDLAHEESLLKAWNIPYLRAIAYPFGARPKNAVALHKALDNFGIRAAFRIGNRLFPLTGKENRFEIKRIDIQGSDSFFEFCIKVKKGRAKLF